MTYAKGELKEFGIWSELVTPNAVDRQKNIFKAYIRKADSRILSVYIQGVCFITLDDFKFKICCLLST
jgi:hypothetical protein